MTGTLDTLITAMTPDRHGKLDRHDAYAVVLGLLDHCRTVDDSATTTANELWKVLTTIPGREAFGGRGLFHQLLRQAADEGQLRRTPGDTLLLRLDVHSGSEVEVTGAAPWPNAQLHAPGPAWWRCTGCRANSGTRAADFEEVREAATEHAATCRALPAPAYRPSR